MNRRDFLKRTAGTLTAAGVATVPARAGAEPSAAGDAETQRYTPLFAARPIPFVRIGYVGFGNMGTVHVTNLLNIAGCRITAVCDVDPGRAVWAVQAITAAGHPTPAVYTRGPRDFERMCGEQDLDLVYSAVPWEWHVPICLSAMRNGKHTATEVPAAMTVEECWALVESAEKYQKHCVMMENCNYGREEMLIFHLTRLGMFGEILHGEAAYHHDLRDLKFGAGGQGPWRRPWSQRLNANLYPTHGLGPIANVMDINRGDRFDYAVSMSGPSRGLQAWAAEHYPAGAPQRREQFALGDVNVSLIKTVNGRTIYLSHNTNNPRPYTRLNVVQGTKGIAQGYAEQIHIEGREPAHQYVHLGTYLSEFSHPLWRQIGHVAAALGGHGGMDYLEDYRLIKCLREGLPTDMNVYDAAALSSLVGVTAYSVERTSRPVAIPDFTRGRWSSFPKLELVQA